LLTNESTTQIGFYQRRSNNIKTAKLAQLANNVAAKKKKTSSANLAELVLIFT